MEVTIELLSNSDILKATKLIKNSKSIVASNVTREILHHISEGIALKLIEPDGKIVGIWCSKDMGEYVSLSYCFVNSSKRNAYRFINYCVDAVDCNGTKPLLLTAKDISLFKNHVEHIEDNIYILRFGKWVV